MSHFDRQYYTRDFMGSHIITTSKFYFQDPEFSTPRDMLLGKFEAYGSLVDYMNGRLFEVHNQVNGAKQQNNTKKLHWPFTNTDWVELIYALSTAAKTKQVDLSIIELSNKLQQVFNHKPQNHYKTYQDLKNRKTSRTQFLDHLTTILISEMDRSEE